MPLLLMLVALFSGCATPGGAGGPIEVAPAVENAPTQSVNPPANLNLQGFPLPYRQGYADGCVSAKSVERKDVERFTRDGQYRTGWQDGKAICAR